MQEGRKQVIQVAFKVISSGLYLFNTIWSKLQFILIINNFYLLEMKVGQI